MFKKLKTKIGKMSTKNLLGWTFLVVLVLFTGIKLWAGRPVSAAWFNTNWSYRQKMPISNSSGSTQTDFQVKETIDTATLITAGKLQSNCNDIRFTDISGKVLPYWIEPTTCNTASTLVWVKVPSIPSQTSGITTDIYFYYGNPSAPAASNSATTFIRDTGGISGAVSAANWPLDDTVATQSYSRVVNPAVATGRNIVINGTFDTDTIWTKEHASVTISGGTLNFAATPISNGATQALPMTVGKAYSVSFTISNWTAGSLQVSLGLAGAGTIVSGNGTYTQTIVCATDATMRIRAITNPLTANIDNVIVTQLNIPASNATPTQLLTDGDMEAVGTAAWTAINSTLSKDGNTPHSGTQSLKIVRTSAGPLAKQIILTIGQVYRVYGYARSDGNGVAIPSVRTNGLTTVIWAGSISTSWQPFDVVFVANATDLNLAAGVTATNGDFVEFDDVTVSVDTGIRQGELTQDPGLEVWSDASTLTNWTKTVAGTSTLNREASVIHSGSFAARLDIDGSGSFVDISQQILNTGKTYVTTFWAKSDAVSGVTVAAENSFSGAVYTSFSLTNTYAQYTTTFVATGTGFGLKRNTGTANHSIYIDDISVTEVDPMVGIPTNGVVLGSASGGHLTNAYTFDGTNDNVNVYSSDLNSAFNPSEGTMVAWAEVSGAGVWTDATTRYISILGVDGSNQLRINKTTVNNTLTFIYLAGGTTSQVSSTALAGSTGWFQIVLTWSKSSDQVKAYINGAQVGSTVTGLGTWVGNFGSTSTVIGSASNAGINPWQGMINDVRLYTRALSSAEIADEYSATSDIQAFTTNNFFGHELLRKYNDLVTVNAAAAEEIGPGPVAYWNFDEGTGQTVHDGTQNANNGTLSGSPLPIWQNEDQCVSGKCLYFDGSNGTYVSLGSNVPALRITGALTLSAWVRFSDVTTSRDIIAKNTGVASTSSYVLFINTTGKLGMWISDGASITQTNGNTALNNNQWYYVTAVYSPSTSVTIYVNGVQDAQNTTSIPASLNNSATFPQIGAQGAGSTNRFKGFMDEPKVYNYARSAAQVQVDYNSGAVKLGKVQQRNFLSNGLVGYWKMDEASWTNDCSTLSVLDSSGNGNNAASCPNGTGPTGGAAGKFGNAGSFDGTNDYVDIANNLLNPSTSDFSASTWFYLTSFPSSGAYYGFVIQKAAPGTGRSWLAVKNVSGSTVVTEFLGGIDHLGTTTLATSTWYHLVITKTGTTVNLYLNGNLENSSTVAVDSATGGMYLGTSSGANANFLNGRLDEVRVYNRALSPVEVKSLYNWAPGPTAYYNFDEKTGTAVNDISGNGNTGTWQGTFGNQWTQGKIGAAGNFNGTDNYVSIGTTPPITSVSQLTISGWVKVNVYSSQAGVFSTFATSTPDHGVLMETGVTSNDILVGIADGVTNPYGFTSTGLYAPGTWHYWTMVFDGTQTGNSNRLKFFLDGVQQTLSYNGTIPAITTSTLDHNPDFGSRQGSSLFLNGQIDDFKIYNYARISSQILEDMNGQTGSPAGGGVGVLPKPIAYYAFDEQQGQVVNNSGITGSSLNGTLGANSSVASDDPTWVARASGNCKINGCLNFNGTGNLVNIYSTALNSAFSGSEGSISVWAKVSNSSILTDGSSHVISIFEVDGNNFLDIFKATTNNRLQLNYSAGGTPKTVITDTLNNIGTSWFQVGVTWSKTNDQLKFYLNGQQVGSTQTGLGTWAGNLASANNVIGAISTAGVNPWSGSIDGVKIYNTPLTASQVQLDYNAGSSISYSVLGASEASLLTDTAGNAPVAYWNFDEKTGTTANDISGNNNTGTWQGTFGNQWTQGKIGAAGNFNGTDNYVSSTSSPLDPSATNFTASTWFYMPSLPASVYTLISQNTGVGWLLAKNTSGTVTLDTFLSGSDNLGATSLSANTWYYATLTKSGTTVTLYLNGKSDGVFTISPSSITGVIQLGTSATHALNFLNGKLDDVKIYNYARTQAQVAYDYNRGGPIGWWQFDNCQGTVAYDNSGFGNNGTIVIGGTGTQTAVGTCNTSGTAWGNGAIGKFNSSLSFDGTDDYVNFTRSSSVQSIATQGTISFWANYSILDTTTFRTAVDIAQTGVHGLIMFTNSITATRPFLQYGNGTDITIVSATRTFTTGVWYHIVGTWSSAGGKIYVNGVLENSSATAPAITISAGNAYIGAQSGTIRFFGGQLDDIRIYNYALSLSQIQQLYNGGSEVRFGPLTGTP